MLIKNFITWGRFDIHGILLKHFWVIKYFYSEATIYGSSIRGFSSGLRRVRSAATEKPGNQSRLK